ncbi:translesion error-prone DNA polymerase V autoproteolytic subunit [Arsukibacterium sp. UBA3155]|uniref:translesion error-prone DNA polymerase V autoproteolytic subunit n=1 Tax=Arsukibacterium sp. UBA3155 TaxID=1946058 RepID=UPI0025BC0616|nr:translesion error-prone DNA polymerase V autoproteolytic subunit [Arsukibacterium sp. UBA3155]|tara:strand:+ start:103792 stop:104223 length:432 start_codon:yes stop_codon:yes gene_type:complete
MAAVFIGNASIWPRRRIPFYSDPVRAGFPSPAQDYIERTLDLNELCIRHPTATFFVRVEGDSMIDAGIYDGDVLVVDRAINAEHGDIVVAALGHEFTVKQLATQPQLQLLPRNPAYQPITLTEGDELNIFGVVTNVIRQMKRK